MLQTLAGAGEFPFMNIFDPYKIYLSYVLKSLGFIEISAALSIFDLCSSDNAKKGSLLALGGLC